MLIATERADRARARERERERDEYGIEFPAKLKSSHKNVSLSALNRHGRERNIAKYCSLEKRSKINL